MYVDLSKYMLDIRRQLSISKAPHNQEIEYKWKQPSKLSIDRNDTSYAIALVEAGLALLNTWNIILNQYQNVSSEQRGVFFYLSLGFITPV